MSLSLEKFKNIKIILFCNTRTVQVAKFPYCRLHLPVNARSQNMFSRDVKRLSFRCQTLKFSRPMRSNIAQRKDVFNEQERKKLSERCPTFKRFMESSERTFAELFFSKSLAKIRIRTPGGGGGGDSHMKQTGMLVVSLRGVNFGFWSLLGCSGQSANILSRQALF